MGTFQHRNPKLPFGGEVQSSVDDIQQGCHQLHREALLLKSAFVHVLLMEILLSLLHQEGLLSAVMMTVTKEQLLLLRGLLSLLSSPLQHCLVHSL